MSCLYNKAEHSPNLFITGVVRNNCMTVDSFFHQKFDTNQVEESRKGEVNHLPEELLLHIFSYLDDQGLLKSDRVCKEWHAIQIKYAVLLDKTWKLKWFKDYSELRVEKKITWKENCLRVNKWVSDNPVAYYFNQTNFIQKNFKAQDLFDDEVSTRKLKCSLLSVPLLWIGSFVAVDFIPAFSFKMPLMIIRKALSICESIAGRKFSVIDKARPIEEKIDKTVLKLTQWMFLAVFIVNQVIATKGMRMNLQSKVSNCLRLRSSCNIL